MRRVILLISILSFFSIINIQAEKFTFKFKKGSKQKIEAVINGEQYLNQEFIVSYNQYYKTVRTYKDYNNNLSEIEDINYFYNQNKYINNKLLEIKDSRAVNYSKDQLGKMIVFDNGFFPTYRNIPVFPDKEIEPGFTWTIEGKEVQDLFGDSTISEFTFNVVYTFIGYENIENKKVAKFSYEFVIDEINKNNGKIDPRIFKIYGESKTIMYFDNEKGTRIKEEYSRDYSFILNDQQSIYTFIDKGIRIWHDVELMDKDKIIGDINKKIEEEKLKDTKVLKDDKGIKLLMENLHFFADSTELLPEEKERLDKIANILKDYKDKNIMIIGHTALAGTEESRYKLSVDRAKLIIDYLVQKGAIDPAKGTYQGKGAAEPVAPNDTEENMKKNRRVEIYILEE